MLFKIVIIINLLLFYNFKKGFLIKFIMALKNRITKIGYEKLKQKRIELLQELEKTTDDANRAKEAGDLRENADHKASTTRIIDLKNDINDIENKLQSVIIVEPTLTKDVIDFGVSFTAIIPDIFGNQDANLCMIVGECESNLLEGLFSENSEIGKALIGKKPNEQIKINGLYIKILQIQ